MKKTLTFTLSICTMMLFNLAEAQCSGGSSFTTVAAPTSSSTTTINTCNYAGDFNTITGVVAGNSYTLTAIQNGNGANRCITIHTGSSTGPVVAYGMGTVTFTAPSAGTYYMTISQNCTGCLSNNNCITTTIECNACSTGPCAGSLNIGGCGQVYLTTTSGASSYVSTLCATSTPGLESFFTYTATSTGNYSFDISSVTGGGYAIGYKTVTSGCTSTGWTCVGTYTTPGTTATLALAAGTTYYFLFDATSTASSEIDFSLVCPSGGPTVAGDCGVAANVCSSAAFSVDPNGYGTTNEICIAGTCAANPDLNPTSFNEGCLLSGELNSTWMVVNVLTGGSLTFSMGTPNSGTFNCLDWSMWPYNATACSAISAGTLAPVRCNYNGMCEEFTGLASSLPSGASSMTNWESPVTVASSSRYVICLSNYSSAITTVPLSFGGTAVVSCTPLGAELIELAGTAETGYNSLNWTSSLELNANRYVVERSTDGVHYSTIDSLDAGGFTMESKSYSYNDVTPEKGVNYYRIVLVHDNGSKMYSNLLSVNQSFAQMTDVIRAYPNPVTDKLNVLLNAGSAAEYELSLSALNGNEVFHTSTQAKNGVNQLVIATSNYANGFYLLRVILEGKTIATQKIIVQ